MTSAQRRFRAFPPRTLQEDLAYLNARVPHRFTGIFALQDGMIVNTHLYDKQKTVGPELLEAVPFTDSFCQFVLRDGVFLTDDSNADDRLAGHRFQGVVVSYHGVPVMADENTLYGTLCHFDFVPHDLSHDELDLLHLVARRLPPHLI